MDDERQSEPERAPAPPADEPAMRKTKKKKKGAAQRKTEAAEDTPPAPAPKAALPPGLFSNKMAWILATVSIVLCPIGFVGIDIWPVAFIAWAPLIVALRDQPPKRALWLGLYAGTAMLAAGFYWLVYVVEVFGGFPLWLALIFAGVLCVQKAGRIALCCWLSARASARGWHRGLSFVGAFAVSELVYPVLFPWYYGGALHKVPALIQIVDLLGPIALSAMVIAVNVALAELVVHFFGDKLGAKAGAALAFDKRTLIAGAAAPLVALAYGLFTISRVDAAAAGAQPLKVGMVQGNSPLKNRSKAMQVHLDETEKLRKQGVDLVVWAEAGVSRSFSAQNYELHMKRGLTGRLGVPTIVGTVLRGRVANPTPDGPRIEYFNTALMSDKEGNITGRYDKQVLLMFGEYIPFGDTFPALYDLSRNSGRFTPGTSFQPLVHDGHPISVMICYEDIIPSFVNQLVDTGNPELLVNMTNDTWFGDSAEPWQHLALAKLRSVEHHKYLVRVTNSGVSAIIDPVGRELVVSQTFVRQALVGEVRWMKGTSVYAVIGNIPWWIAAAFMGLCAFVRRPTKGERRF